MRVSELEGKEVINIRNGDRLGIIQKSELLVNVNTGTVEALIIVKSGWAGKLKEVKTIPWQEIRKISDDLIIVESEESDKEIEKK